MWSHDTENHDDGISFHTWWVLFKREFIASGLHYQRVQIDFISSFPDSVIRPALFGYAALLLGFNAQSSFDETTQFMAPRKVHILESSSPQKQVFSQPCFETRFANIRDK